MPRASCDTKRTPHTQTLHAQTLETQTPHTQTLNVPTPRTKHATKRLFIALWPSDAARQALVTTQRDLAPQLARARATSAQNLHLTLAFLGNCDAAQEAGALRAVRHAAQRSAAFELSLSTVGSFEKRRGGAIVWRGLAGDTTRLFQLHTQLSAALEAEGLGDFQTSSPGAYRPHMTLFRNVRLKSDSEFTDLSSALEAFAAQHANDARWAASWKVLRLALVWSHRQASDGPLRYDEIAHADFSGD